MSDETAAQDDKEPARSRAPSPIDRVQVAAHVDVVVRRELQILSVENGVTVQHLLCVAINDLLEKHKRSRMADETMLPRGAAAHRRR